MIYLPMGDHVYRAFPDDVPGGAFIPLTEHYTTQNKTKQRIKKDKGLKM